jgi:small subunit ribosomal protein S28
MDRTRRLLAATPATFASLVRHCKFTAMGDPVGKVVVGRIYHVVGEDLYIDFGHKFGCVCRAPRDDRRALVRGAEVRLKVNSLELSKRFLGYDTDLSLLEADCTLLGLNK